MPSPEQMEADVRRVLEYCRNYAGPHEDVFSALRERVSEIDEGFDEFGEDQRQARLSSVYEDAISTLLLLASPPGIETYDQVLGGIGELAGTRIKSVHYYPDSRAEATIAEQHYIPLRENLQPRRPLTTEQRETLAYFRAQLSAYEGNDSPFGE